MSHRRHGHRRRHRNPFSAGGVGPLAVKVAGGLGGGIAAAGVPPMLSTSFSTGWPGVGSGLVVALGGAWLLKRMSQNASEGWLIGGLLQTAGRLTQLLIGRNVVSFSLGHYGPLQFGVPSPAYRAGAGALPPTATVASVPAGGSSVTKAPVTAMRSSTGSKWSSRAA